MYTDIESSILHISIHAYLHSLGLLYKMCVLNISGFILGLFGMIVTVFLVCVIKMCLFMCGCLCFVFFFVFLLVKILF